MREIDFLPIGDLHLTGLQSLFGDKGDDLIYKGLDQCLTYASRHGIKTIIFLGDLFDSPFPAQDDITRFLRYVHGNPQFTFRAILGNHDRQNAVTHSSRIIKFIDDSGFISNFKLYDEPGYEEVNGIPLYFLPWPHVKHPSRVNHPVINIAHVSAVGALGDNGRALDKGHELYESDDRWVVGDLHTYQRPRKDVIYPGTFFQKNFGESLPKGFVHSTARIGKRLRVTHKYIPIEPPFKLVNVVVHSEDDLKQVDRNPLHKYKLFIKSDIALPADYTERNPNVVSVLGYKTKHDLSALQDGTGETVSIVDSTKLATANLSDFLTARGMSSIRVRRARDVVKDLLKGV